MGLQFFLIAGARKERRKVLSYKRTWLAPSCKVRKRFRAGGGTSDHRPTMKITTCFPL